MTLLAIMGISVALAMDAFAVSIAAGAFLRDVGRRPLFRIWWHFGLFQAMMLVGGWGAGITVREWIESVDHWVAFGLLAFVAANMLWGAFRGEEEGVEKKDPTRGMPLVMLSLATSMDALAVGLSLSILNISIWLPALAVGGTAAILSAIGMVLGSRAARLPRLGRFAETGGGLVLLAIGVHILYEHGVLSW